MYCMWLWSSQRYDFSSGHVWLWELDYKESWAPKNWCFWRRLLRVPWTARRSNQSILKEISPGCSLEGLMLKLKLQYLGHLMWRADSFEKTLMLGAGGEGDNRGWDGWMASLTQWTWVWGDSGSWWWTRRPGMLWFMGSQRVEQDWVTELKWWLNWASQVALMVKNKPTNAGDIRNAGLIPGLRRSPGEGHSNPLQYSCLENPMDRGAGGLQSMGSQRVRHNWRDLACMYPWLKWQCCIFESGWASSGLWDLLSKGKMCNCVSVWDCGY